MKTTSKKKLQFSRCLCFVGEKQMPEKPQTIAEYYSALDPEAGLGNLEVLAYGEFLHVEAGPLTRWGHWDELFLQCAAVINELRDQPFNGAPTCGLVMDMALKRYQHNNGGHRNMPKNKQVPPVWFYLMNKLRKMPPLFDVPDNFKRIETRYKPKTPHGSRGGLSQ